MNEIHDAHERHEEPAPMHHVVGVPIYIFVFLGLMVLTFLTVLVSTFDLGRLNTPIALAIAVVKASLVILFFMHVIYSTRLTWVVILASLLWLGVLFVLTFSDYLTRGWSMYQ